MPKDNVKVDRKVSSDYYFWNIQVCCGIHSIRKKQVYPEDIFFYLCHGNWGCMEPKTPLELKMMIFSY
jgi:hypothetical protein